MDHGVATPPAVDSADRDEKRFLDPSWSGMKRKRQLRQLGLPSPKQKLRGRRSSSDRGSPAPHHLGLEESADETLNQAKREESSSCEDSNEFHGLSGEGYVELSSKVLVPQYEPSLWPSSVEDVASMDDLYSSDSSSSRVVKNADTSQGVLSVAQERPDSGEGTQLVEAQKQGESLRDELPVLGVDDGVEYMEEGLHGALHTSMPCSNDEDLTPLGLHSGRCSIKQEAFAGRRPTIDQEFEQYFSMFML